MEEKSAAPEETERIRKDVRSSLLIVLPLTLLAFAFSPGLLAASALGIDLGPLSPEGAPLLFAGIDLSLALAMLLACKSILVRGVRLLFKSPCADSLIAVSAISAVIASLLLIVQMALTGEALFHQLLFTPLGLLLTFTLGGKYLEARLAKQKASLDEEEGVVPPGAEEMMAEHEAERQRREEEERRKKESEARYRELEALRAEERRLAEREARRARGEALPAEEEEEDEPAASDSPGQEEAAKTPEHTPLLVVTDNAALRFLAFGLLLAIADAVLWQTMGLDPLQTAIFFFSVLFFACPAALFFASSFALPEALKKCRAQKILVKNAGVFGTLKHISAIALSKSGGITEGRPFLATIVGEGLSDSAILGLAASAENGVSHPLARVLVASAVSRGARLMRVSATSSIPGKGVEALINGRAVRLGKREWLEEEGVHISNSLLTQGDQFASRGKIVIYLATGKIAKGLLVFSDEARSDMPRTIRLLESLGVQTVMMTGDCRTAAKRTAKDAGISVCRADLSPADKAKEVQMLQAHGHSVALLAAKKEDAEAASMADVVLAMQTSEGEIAPDILIASGDPSHIPQLITLSRKTVRTVRLALALAFLAAVLAAVLLHASLFFGGDLRFLPLLSVLSMLAGIVAATLVPLELKGFKFAPHTLDY
ncbi:HAD-IC family P-type ATPase [Selenomonas sputigena]|uniref:HAD-IC family P-type ATPase n=1 Tax=Selenomonas sputigena TaxID=69823 RepID=UPI0022318B7C|nr:HAD-IC family P-type ATPase [Selenomonas sputigena]UZD43217.1 HAD-IC family P-type ATPase [Selenomonas sputigena]